ncbi:MAG: lactate utilization protein [Desulfuromonadaceae bacterium]|nr:lactate utilization protein [Desulfuromonadaceae bacterium]MDD2856592.1 lactate utilization protein [Desulfuromonadaceae bacterium]
MYQQFKSRGEGVGAEVHRFVSGDIAVDFIIRFLRQEGVGGEPGIFAVSADCRFLNQFTVNPLKAIPEVIFDITRETSAGARVGISQMDWAIADTGTLAQNSTAVEQRLVSSLPAIHIAIVATDSILPDMPALLAKVHPAECGYLAMITGPSRTADIERVLTIGVHGPERLIVLFVDDLKGA